VRGPTRPGRLRAARRKPAHCIIDRLQGTQRVPRIRCVEQIEQIEQIAQAAGYRRVPARGGGVPKLGEGPQRQNWGAEANVDFDSVGSAPDG
jgi:hypothetical protein